MLVISMHKCYWMRVAVEALDIILNHIIHFIIIILAIYSEYETAKEE